MAGKTGKAGGGRVNVIIRREEVVEGGHHGGAWKVAYADFVTAMMAFFLLMWLLNATTEDQRKGLADYFSPNNLLSHASSGTGEPFGGHTAFDDGALVSDRGSVEISEGRRTPASPSQDGPGTPTSGPADDPGSGKPAVAAREAAPAPEGTRADAMATGTNPNAVSLAGSARIAAVEKLDGGRKPTTAELQVEAERREKAAFEQAAQQIRDAVHDDPALADIARQLAIDMTPDGLRIQIMDEIGLPMFASGSAEPNERARLLMRKVVSVLARLPQAISIAGHTDAAPYPGPGRTNWELSTERANATRRLMVDSGLGENRIRSVTGNADRDPLLPADPLAAANRRIAILVLRDTKPPPR